MSVRTKEEIRLVLCQNQSRIMALGVARLGLFGSFVRDQQRVDSGVDLLVEFEPGEKSFDNFMQLCFLLEDLLGRAVELVAPEGLSAHTGPHILEDVAYVPFAA